MNGDGERVNGQPGDRPVGVMFVSHCERWPGSQWQLQSLLASLTSLDRDRFSPVVVVPEDGEFTDALRRMDIEPVIRPLPAWVGPRECAEACAADFATGFAGRIASLEMLIRSRDVRVVVSDTALIADGAIAAARAALPHVWRVHQPLDRDLTIAPPIAVSSLYGLMAALSDRIVVPSQAVRDEIASCASADDVVVIPVGWPAAAGDGRGGAEGDRPKGPGKRITFIGVVSARNIVRALVEAAAVVLRKHADATFWLVGPDDESGGEVFEAIQRLGIDRQVFILGERGNREEILGQTQVVVLEAVADPCPLAVLEAMRAGLPVVAPHGGDREDLIVDGETGFLVPVDDAAALADRLCRLLDNPAAARGLGDRGRQLFLQRFTGERHVRELEEVLATVAAGGRRRPASSLDWSAIHLLEDAYALGGRLHASREQITQARHELRAIQERLHDIEHSLAWQATAPVRNALDVIRVWWAYRPWSG